MSEYTDTILLECNRKQSPEYLSKIEAGNPSHWTNNLGSGVKLDIGDQISVHSSYMSAVGNEAATIEIKGRTARNNLEVGQVVNLSDTIKTKTENDPSIGDILYTYTPTTIQKEISDFEINLVHSYYKTTNGEYYYTLPRQWTHLGGYSWRNASYIWNQYTTTNTGQIAANVYRYADDYVQDINYQGEANGSIPYNGSYNHFETQNLTQINNDGSRYTLFVNDYISNSIDNGSLLGHRDPALFNYQWYKRAHTYTIKKGFNSPANVAEDFTDQMADVRHINRYQDISATLNDKKNRNFDLTAESRMNEPFPCAFGVGTADHAGKLYTSGGGAPDFQSVFGGAVVIEVEQAAGAGSPLPYPIDVFESQNWLAVVNATMYNAVEIGMFVVFDGTGTGNGAADAQLLEGAQVIDKEIFTDGGKDGYIIFFDRTIESRTSNFAGAKAEYSLNFRDQYRTYENYYQACYATVGFKRPEIQEYGRRLDNESGFGTTPQFSIDGSFSVYETTTTPLSASNVIKTTLDWNDTNLLLLKDFFDQQKVYPELFNTSDMSTGQVGLINNPSTLSVDNSRFLHMNIGNSDFVSQYITLATVSGSFQVTLNSTANIEQGMILIEDTSGPDLSNTFPIDFSDVNERVAQRTYVENVSGNVVTMSRPATVISNTGAVLGALKFTNKKLGFDRYSGTSALHTSGALFFDYNKDRAEMNSGEGRTPDPYETLRYGFGIRTPEDKIGFYFGQFRNGIPNTWTAAGVLQANTRQLGFDKHFNAYGTAAINLYNGLAGRYGMNFSGTERGQMYKTYQDRNDLEGVPVSGHVAGPGAISLTNKVSSYSLMNFMSNALMNEIYCGANDPTLSFDPNQSRFLFQRLHTAETVGTNASELNASQVVADSEIICYKVNKRLSRLNWSPNFSPYAHNLAGGGRVILDKNIIPYSIMDARSGVFFEDYGCDEANWAQSLWTLLGFSYSQLHQTEDNRLVRYNDIKLTCSTPTTNALIQTTDLAQWDKGGDGFPLFQPESIPYPQYDGVQTDGIPTATPPLKNSTLLGYQVFPQVVQSCSSTGIIAENLPRKMISPIYLVKSDLLSPSYIGGPESSAKLPVIAVVPKSSGYGDFYNGAEDTVFTNTIPRTVQTIHTAISDADGTDSRLDDGSCVIYKIVKTRQSNSQVIEDILNPPKK